MADALSFEHFEVARLPDGSPHELGRGAMGVTYRAFDTQLRSHVALKVISPSYLDDPVARERFLREARAAAHLNHPNVASVFHLGRNGDTYFYAMQFVEGETLDTIVKQYGPLRLSLALRLILQAAHGLAAAHERGLIHRDVKPGNIMLVGHTPDLADEEDLIVKIIDFGLAKSLVKGESGEVSLTGRAPVGTPNYMSPEQIDPAVGEIDARTDIYSLGITLWYLLAGKPPFEGTQFQIFSQHMNKPPPFGQLPGYVIEPVRVLLARMLAKDPAARPGTYRELIAELKRLVRLSTETSAPADKPSTGAPPPPPPLRVLRDRFLLVSALRWRGTLTAREVFALLDALALLVDDSRAKGDPPLNLDPAQIIVRFITPPSALNELPLRPLDEWPEFTLMLKSSEDSGTHAAGQTLGSHPSIEPAPGRPAAALGAFVYELLAGQRPPAGPYRPLSVLNETTNEVLRQSLDGSGVFQTAADFAHALRVVSEERGLSTSLTGIPSREDNARVLAAPPGAAKKRSLPLSQIAILTLGVLTLLALIICWMLMAR